MKSWIAFALGALVAALLAVAAYVKFVDRPVQLASNADGGTPGSLAMPANPTPAEQPPAPGPAAQPSPPAPAVNPAPPPPGRRPAARPTPNPASNPGASYPGGGNPAPVRPPSPAPQANPPVTPAHTDPVPAPANPPAAPPAAQVSPPPPPRVPKTVTIAEGTLIPVRVMEKITTETHKDGDSFSATLDEPLVVDGSVIAEKGSRVQGKVAQSVQAGRVKGVAQLVVELTTLHTSDGQTVAIHTAGFAKEGPKSTGSDAAKVGIGAAIGSAIGAIAGGGKGAAIGAAAGAGAGGGAVVATRGKPAEIPVETRLTFRLSEAVKLTERIK